MVISDKNVYFKDFGITQKNDKLSITNESNISIVVDWLKISGECKNFPLPSLDESFMQKDEFSLVYTGSGSRTHKYLFEVFYLDEKFAYLETCPNLPEMSAFNFCLQIENNLLYTSDYLSILQSFLETFEAKYKNVTRLDIALDGVNYLIPFLNSYWKDCKGLVTRKGKKTRKSKKSGFSALYLDEKQNQINGFRFGSQQSDKFITIYNKSLELETSNKKYISRFWELNGLNTNVDNYRFELRLNSKAVATIKNFDIWSLQDSGYLGSILKTHTKNYFDFSFGADKNVSRRPTIEIFDFEKMQSILLEKCKKKEITDRYKAKLSVHCLYKLLFEKRITEARKNEVNGYISELLERFDLNDWFLDRLPSWREKYTKIGKNTDIVFNQVLAFWVQFGLNANLSKDRVKTMLIELDFNDLLIYYKDAKESGFNGAFKVWRKIFENYKDKDFTNYL